MATAKLSWTVQFLDIGHIPDLAPSDYRTFGKNVLSRCAEIAMLGLAWMTLSAPFKRGLCKRLLLSSKFAPWTTCHAGKVHC